MQRPRNRAGFTLLEVMIVVVILGILASTVLPQFRSTQETAMESTLVTSLSTLRTQIHLYKMQHGGILPAAGSTTPADFTTAMTSRTNAQGGADANGQFGPYVTGQLPTNPFTGSNTLLIGTALPGATATDGWRYNSSDGTIKPCYNSGTNYGLGAGLTPSGKTFDSL